MKDPYSVLGLQRGASEEEVKAKHRELIKKYHPDRYQNNPLEELAEEKTREINEAYDTIMREMKNSKSHYGSSGSTYTSSGEFNEIRRTIDANDLNRAESMLNTISDRNAEWWFLSSVISYKKGWYDDAMSKAQTAVSMAPDNMEYRNYLNQLIGMGAGFQNRSYNMGYNRNDDCCRMMMCYCCVDSMCDCI